MWKFRNYHISEQNSQVKWKVLFLFLKTWTFCEKLFEKKNDEKEKTNQVCEDCKQMFVTALSANDHTTYDWIVNSSVNATHDI